MEEKPRLCCLRFFVMLNDAVRLWLLSTIGEVVQKHVRHQDASPDDWSCLSKRQRECGIPCRGLGCYPVQGKVSFRRLNRARFAPGPGLDEDPTSGLKGNGGPQEQGLSKEAWGFKAREQRSSCRGGPGCLRCVQDRIRPQASCGRRPCKITRL